MSEYSYNWFWTTKHMQEWQLIRPQMPTLPLPRNPNGLYHRAPPLAAVVVTQTWKMLRSNDTLRGLAALYRPYLNTEQRFCEWWSTVLQLAVCSLLFKQYIIATLFLRSAHWAQCMIRVGCIWRWSPLYCKQNMRMTAVSTIIFFRKVWVRLLKI